MYSVAATRVVGPWQAAGLAPARHVLATKGAARRASSAVLGKQGLRLRGGGSTIQGVVAREVLELDRDPQVAALLSRADEAHRRWQIEGSSYWACSDQFVSGQAAGSRYYPRCVTTALWLDDVTLASLS